MSCSLSILITYFGEERLLTECLESLLGQNSFPDEILVYDDASRIPAERFIPQGYPAKVIRGKVNQGPAYGRNQLLKLAASEYVHFHDSDDLFYPEWCGKVRRKIEQTQSDIIITEIASFRDDKLVCSSVLGLNRLFYSQDLVDFALSGSILVPSTTFRKNIAVGLGGYRTRETLPQSEDFDFHVRLAATGASYSVIEEPLIIQRLRNNSHSADKVLCWTSAITSIKLLKNELHPQYRDDLAEFCARTGGTLYGLGAFSEAREAFQLARKLGKPKFLDRSRFYKLIASILGQERAEKIGKYYRHLKNEEKKLVL